MGRSGTPNRSGSAVARRFGDRPVMHPDVSAKKWGVVGEHDVTVRVVGCGFKDFNRSSGKKKAFLHIVCEWVADICQLIPAEFV